MRAKLSRRPICTRLHLAPIHIRNLRIRHQQGRQPEHKAIEHGEIGARRRERLLLSSWCLSKRHSAKTRRTPPGQRNLTRVTSRWIARISTSRMSGKLSRRPINTTLNLAAIPVRNYEFVTHGSRCERIDSRLPPGRDLQINSSSQRRGQSVGARPDPDFRVLVINAFPSICPSICVYAATFIDCPSRVPYMIFPKLEMPPSIFWKLPVVSIHAGDRHGHC
jgi:hypothetical protein